MSAVSGARAVAVRASAAEPPAGERVLDRRAEPDQPVLQQVVDRAQAQRRHAGLLVHHPADHDQRDVELQLAEDPQGVQRGHRRQRVVADHDVRLIGQPGDELLRRLHPGPGRS
jgi:hypothetical protein